MTWLWRMQEAGPVQGGPDSQPCTTHAGGPPHESCASQAPQAIVRMCPPATVNTPPMTAQMAVRNLYSCLGCSATTIYGAKQGGTNHRNMGMTTCGLHCTPLQPVAAAWHSPAATPGWGSSCT